MHLKHENLKICIAGCGLGGMITALALASKGINSTILERQDINSPEFFNDIRTTALTDASKNFFESIGIWQKIEKIAGPINDIYVADNKAPDMVHFASADLANGAMGYLVENKVFKKFLLDQVLENQHIELIPNSLYEIKESNEYKCVVNISESLDFVADMLVVCDGKGSYIRQKYFSSQTEKDYDQNALTFIVEHEKPHEGTAVEHFLPTGPFAILPLKEQHLSSVVWTITRSMNEAMLKLPQDEFLYLVQQNFGEFLGKVTIKSKVASFPLRAYATGKYYNKRIVLVADSAHVIHPLAGQGLNQGIKDIESLVNNVIAFGCSESAFEKYQHDRKQDNDVMLEITDIINSVFSNNSKLLHTARQVGFKAVEKIHPFKKLLVKYAMGKR